MDSEIINNILWIVMKKARSILINKITTPVPPDLLGLSSGIWANRALQWVQYGLNFYIL